MQRARPRPAFHPTRRVGTLRQRDTCIRNSEGQSYFVVDVQANKNANKPDDCWATWDRRVMGMRGASTHKTWA